MMTPHSSVFALVGAVAGVGGGLLYMLKDPSKLHASPIAHLVQAYLSEHLFRNTVKAFLLGFTLKGSLASVFAVSRALSTNESSPLVVGVQSAGASPAETPLRAFWKSYLCRDTLRFGLFVGTISGTYRIVRILVDVARLHFTGTRPLADGWSAALAGAVAAISILLLPKHQYRWEFEMMMFCLLRSASLLVSHLADLGCLPTIPQFDTWAFSLLCGCIMYAFVYEPDLLQRSYAKWIHSVGLDGEGKMSYFLAYLRGRVGVAYNPKTHQAARTDTPKHPCHYRSLDTSTNLLWRLLSY